MSDSPDGNQTSYEHESTAGGTGSEALEQWKFYGQTAQNVSKRRQKTNRFYQKLVLGTFAGVGAGVQLGVINSVVLFVVGTVGIMLSVLWMAHVISYKQLNSGKYSVMREIATKELPFSPFHREWTVLDKGQDPKEYITHTSVEIWWPRVTLWVFGLMAITGALTKLGHANNLFGGALLWSGLMLLYGWRAFRGKTTPFDYIAPYWAQEDDE